LGAELTENLALRIDTGNSDSRGLQTLEEVRGNDAFWKNDIIGAGVENTIGDGKNVSSESDGEVGAPGRAMAGKGELRRRVARIRLALV
jgi:hypothetical protein